MATVGCGNREGLGPRECRDNTDCPTVAPFCVNDTCVECVTDDDCDCSAICDNGACEVLGAHLGPEDAGPGNAHGTWQGTPGSSNYAFLGTCSSDADCPVIGQLCNPFTKGCVNAADFGDDDRCDSPDDCPAGTACATELNEPVCLPTPICRTNRNCCGQAGLACGSPPGEMGLCIASGNECTPPDEVESACPFLPKDRGGDCGGAPCCDAGLFCANFGKCVECQCDLDCDTNGTEKCYPGEFRCRPADYCVLSSDCDPGEACDVPNTACRPACTPETENVVCGSNEFCSAQYNVCRPLTERPCEADVYEPNQSLGTAGALPLPPFNQSRTESDLSLCTGDVDWYAVALNAGEQLLVQGTGLGGAQGDLTAIGPDQLTPVGTPGFFGTFPALLELTAHSTGTYYLNATPSGNNLGFYNLTLTRTNAPTCSDPFEAAEGVNDTPAGATPLFEPGAAQPPTGCDLAVGAGGVQVLSCEQGLSLCYDDVDYFVLRAPNGADLITRLYGFGGNLDLSLYGPFDPSETPSTSRLLAQSTGPNTAELVATTARPESVYLLRVFSPTRTSTDYRLEVEMRPPLASCPEDAYDDLALPGVGSPTPPTLVDDPEGYNDRVEDATAVALVPGETVVLDGTPLTLCRADADWFELGRDVGGVVSPFGPQQRVELTLVPEPSSTGVITLAAGLSPTPLTTDELTASSLPFGSTNPNQPVHAVSIPTGASDRIYVKVMGAPSNAAHVSYRLHARWIDPPACDLDTLGDLGPTQRNDAPADATVLGAGTGWPGAAGESRRYGDIVGESLTLCAQNDDWYAVQVPAGHELVAVVGYNPNEANVALAAYGSAVASIDTPTAGQLPPGALALADTPGRFRQRVSVSPSTAGTVFLAVSNRTGWPLLQYTLEVHLLASACFEDEHELPLNNNTWERATVFPLAPLAGSPGIEVGALDPLAICSAVGGEQDFYAIALQPGDELDATLVFDPSKGQLTFNLHGPGPAGLTSILDSDTAQSSGRLQLSFAASDDDPLGNYLLRVLPATNPRHYYYIEATVRRGCEDDAREPAAGAEVFAFDAWQPSYTPLAQTLCFDEDWFSVTVPAGSESFTVCTGFDASAVDLLLAVYDGADSSNPARPVGQGLLGFSDARADHQRVVVSRTAADPENDYFIHVYPTYTPKPNPFVPPHPFHEAYQLWIAPGVVDCPPQVCQSAADCSGRGDCDPSANGGLGVCTCDVGFTGATCEACAPGFYGPSCLFCGSCGAGVCEDGKQGRGCVALQGQPCAADAQCASGRCAPDWNGADGYCAASGDTCVYFDGATVLDRPDGWVECGDGAAYKVCEAGVWTAGMTCGDVVCPPDGEDLACGFVAASTNVCVSGAELGSSGGCTFEDLAATACVDCGAYTASPGACNDTPANVANCSIVCGAACDGASFPSPTGIYYCDGDLRLERVDACDASCAYVDDGPTGDITNRDCAAECGGTCDTGTSDCTCP